MAISLDIKIKNEYSLYLNKSTDLIVCFCP